MARDETIRQLLARHPAAIDILVKQEGEAEASPSVLNRLIEERGDAFLNKLYDVTGMLGYGGAASDTSTNQAVGGGGSGSGNSNGNGNSGSGSKSWYDWAAALLGQAPAIIDSIDNNKGADNGGGNNGGGSNGGNPNVLKTLGIALVVIFALFLLVRFGKKLF